MGGVRAACGRALHGKQVPGGGLPLCFACVRPGSREGCMKNWRHVGTTAFGAELGVWSAAVRDGWTHERYLQRNPLKVGECICCRPDCVGTMYDMFKLRQRKEDKISLLKMVVGQSSPMGRYLSTSSQVRALLENVEVKGGVLDYCGAANDAVRTVLTAYGLRVATNDIDSRLIADTYVDAATNTFVDAYSEDSRRPDWVISSPPYNNAFGILKYGSGAWVWHSS